MKKAKRLLSVVLVALILFSVFVFLPTTASGAINHTQSETVAWIKAKANEGWWQDVDGAYGCQCVDLIKAYYQYFGYAAVQGNAWEYKSGHLPAGSNWSYSSTPIPGSVFVKDKDSTWTMGHVGLVYAVEGSTIYTVETNLVSPYDGGKPYAKAQYRTHPKSYAVTFINPTFSSPVIIGNNPQGNVESLTSPVANKINVCGWAFDKDNLATSIDIHIYIGGPSYSGVPGYRIVANKSRSDLKPHFPELGNNINHGFNETISVSRTGLQDVYIYAYNIGGGENTLLAKKTVNIISNNIGTNNAPQGNIESITSNEAGTINVSGWAFDKDDITAAIEIHVYVGGVASSGAPGYRIVAYRGRDDLKSHFPELRDNIYHGFNETITVSKTGEQEVFLYAIGIANGGNLFLGYGKVNIAVPVPETEPITDNPTESSNTQPVTDTPTETSYSQPITETPTEPIETQSITDKPTESIETQPITNAPDNPEVTQTVTDKPTEAYQPTEPASENSKKFLYLPSGDDQNASYNYKLLVQDNAGNITSYNFEATEMKLDGVTVYSAEIPADITPAMIQYQVYDGNDWVKQITKNDSEISDLNGKVIKSDGSVYGGSNPVVTEPNNTSPEITQPVVTEPPVTTPAVTEPTQPNVPKPTTSKVTNKKDNPIKVTVKAKTVKLKKLKKKAQKVKAITVKNNQGKVTYKLVKSGITKKIRKLVKINSKGVITIKKWKKAKKGTYKIKVKITAAGNSAYNAKSVTKVVKVKIK